MLAACNQQGMMSEYLSCTFASSGGSLRGDLGCQWRCDKALTCQASIGNLSECGALCQVLTAACREVALTVLQGCCSGGVHQEQQCLHAPLKVLSCNSAAIEKPFS